MVAGVLCSYFIVNEPILYASKLPSVETLFTISFHGDALYLVPVYIILVGLLAAGSFSIKKQPELFILCAMLLSLYLAVPENMGPLVRPHERILFLLTVLLPLCCAYIKPFRLEKIIVVGVCLVVYGFACAHVLKIGDTQIGFYKNAVELLRSIPVGKKILPINVTNHLEAYYVIERDGYVPTLFSSQYMTVRYRQSPLCMPKNQPPSFQLLHSYDYLFIRRANKQMVDGLPKIGFRLFENRGIYSVFENTIGNR